MGLVDGEGIKDRELQAYELRKSGKTFKEVGAALSPPVGPARARALVGRAEIALARKERGSVDWREGLTTRSANALRAAGFSSKDEVISAISSGEIEVRSGICFLRGKEIYGFGPKSMAEICDWAGVKLEGPNADHSAALKSRILNAISLLRRNGYVVTKP